MAFINRIRLPIKLSRPQYPEERDVFRKANGVTKVLSVVVKQTWEGQTDFFPKAVHERLKIALAHDIVNIEGEYYVGGISQDGDYNIEWPDFLTPTTAKAAFKVQATPFDATNTSCTTCDELAQVVCNDDDIGLVGEDETVSAAVLDNDEVCCYPATITIVSTNSDFVASAVVNGNNIDITTKTPLPAQDNVNLLTYRVTCENGYYDEADVIADIDGSQEPTCLPPENVTVVDITDSGGVGSWDDPTPPPSDGYGWELYRQDTPGIPIETGTEISGQYPTFDDLEPGTDYELCVRGICGEEFSSYTCYQFTTLDSNEGCGLYRLLPMGHGSTLSATYLTCGGEYSTVSVTLSGRTICAKETSPGNPVSIEGPASMSITYLSECD